MPAAERERILLVDDEPLVLQALRRTFEASGYEVTAATRASEALQLLRDDPTFQVIGSDYRMPEMSGAEFLQATRNIIPDAIRILITAAGDIGAAVDSVNRGEIFRLISKPWNREDLLATFRQAFDHWNLKKQHAELTALVRRQNAELQEMNRSLERLVQERTTNLLDAMIQALDYRDTETQWHSRRVSWYAKRLGQALKIGGDELLQVELGSLLHDIGKIGIPDSILLKPGPLTPEEWVEMRKHPELGYRMLAGIDFLHGARRIVFEHQERWDGTGYPSGIKGDEICIGARIFHIVDTFDAITSDRPYRRARPYDAARDEIVRCTDTQFDPRVTEAFLSVPASDWAEIRDMIQMLAVDEPSHGPR